ncbi:MAG TPA: hypothetical protein H9673_06000 [Candidatus Adamsella sp.]|nr:hypothetical protein [Candidatus Adamsella sp.]
MYITPVNFSHPATGRNKTQNSFNLSISQSNYNLNSYGIQKNADTVSFSGLPLRKTPFEKALSELGLSKKVQKGITQFFDNGKNFFKKIIKSIDSEDIPEELSDEAKQLRQVGEDGLEYFRQLTTKGKIDPATEQQTMENMSNYIQTMRQQLSSPEFDDFEMKGTFLDMFDFMDDMMKKPVESTQEGIDALKKMAGFFKELKKNEEFRSILSEVMKK